MTGKAELQTSAFLKDGTSGGTFGLSQNQPGLAVGGRTRCFGVFLKGAGLNGRNLPFILNLYNL